MYRRARFGPYFRVGRALINFFQDLATLSIIALLVAVATRHQAPRDNDSISCIRQTNSHTNNKKMPASFSLPLSKISVIDIKCGRPFRREREREAHMFYYHCLVAGNNTACRIKYYIFFSPHSPSLPTRLMMMICGQRDLEDRRAGASVCTSTRCYVRALCHHSNLLCIASCNK